MLPTVTALGSAYLSGWPPAPWLAAGIGLANGGLAYGVLGRAAIGYLEPRLPLVFTRIRYGILDVTGTIGPTGRLEGAAQQHEEQERERRLNRSSALFGGPATP